MPRKQNTFRGTILPENDGCGVSTGYIAVISSQDIPCQSDAAAHGDVTIRLSNISKFYSGVPALSDVSVEFYAGEVHAILGENGAGKSTLMNIISGAVHPELGEIKLGDGVISHMSPELAASLGIAISFQHPAILDEIGRASWRERV